MSDTFFPDDNPPEQTDAVRGTGDPGDSAGTPVDAPAGLEGDFLGDDFDAEFGGESDADRAEDFDDDPDAGEFDSADEPESTFALFEGDRGGLSLPQRKALVVLMKNRFVSAAQRPNEWRVIREDPEAIQARLHDMFLDLHIDYRYEVAFKRQAVSETGSREFPTLLHDTAYNREETILLVFLRHRFQSEQNAGHEVVTVDEDDLIAQVASFRPASDKNLHGGKNAAKNAVKNLVKADVLMETNDPGRLRISPVIAVLLPLPRLHELWEWLINENSDNPITVDTPLTDDSQGDGADVAGDEDLLPREEEVNA